MPVKETQRAAADRWDAKNEMCFQSVKIRKSLRDAFKAACAANGDKVNTVLRQAMENYVNGANALPVVGLSNAETLILLGQLASDIEQLQAISDSAKVDDKMRELAAKNYDVIMELFNKILAALPDDAHR